MNQIDLPSHPRILVVALRRLGDVLLTTPLIRSLRYAWPDATIDALALDATGHVPWWSQERSEVTLHQILVHLIAETHRHAGHADIIRELIDGAAGLRDGNDNLAEVGQGWQSYRSRLEQVAQEAGRG